MIAPLVCAARSLRSTPRLLGEAYETWDLDLGKTAPESALECEGFRSHVGDRQEGAKAGNNKSSKARISGVLRFGQYV